jgi:hypothetical protein
VHGAIGLIMRLGPGACNRPPWIDATALLASAHNAPRRGCSSRRLEPPEPFPRVVDLTCVLHDLLSFAAFLAGWYLLQRLVLPRAGVSG